MSIKAITAKAVNGFNSLPGWSKGAIAALGAISLFLIGKKVYTLVFPSELEQRNKALVNGISNDIDKFRNEGLVQSFADAQYQTDANTIYEGMRYAVGDNYAAVEDTLKKMKNNLDVALVMKAFGTRQNYNFGIESGSPMDLFTFVRAELGAEWAGLTDYRVRSINADWLKKGIMYQI